MQETQVRSLGWEHLEEEIETYSKILAWAVLWTKEPGSLQSWGCKRVRHDLATEQHNLCNIVNQLYFS